MFFGVTTEQTRQQKLLLATLNMFGIDQSPVEQDTSQNLIHEAFVYFQAAHGYPSPWAPKKDFDAKCL